MAETHSVSIDTSKDVAPPTLEEQATKLDEQLKAQESSSATPAGDRPEWLPPKFTKGEDLAKAYTELEKKLGERGQEKPEETTEEVKQQPDQAAVDAAAREAATKSGLNLESLSSKFWEKGALDESDYTALEKGGYPKAIVDQFIEGQKAIVDARANSVFNNVGGEDNYRALVAWAGENLEPTEIAAFNKAVNGNDMAQIMLSVKGLKAQYDAQVGFEPSSQVQGQTAVKAGAAVYRSVSEMEKDMADARYWKDPAFRKDVIDKLGRSNIM